jgi:hypothetical protein
MFFCTFHNIYGQNEHGEKVLIDTVYTDNDTHVENIVDVYKDEFSDSWTIWSESCVEVIIEEDMAIC